MAKKPPADPLLPLPAEGTMYLGGNRAMAIQFYAQRIHVSDATAEDKLRSHLTDLGFKELPPVYVPRVS